MSSRQAVDEDRILEGARAALERHGWEGATLERIAAAAGVSRVTLHRRGLSREVILTALSERGVDEYREAMWPVLTAAGTGGERLEAALAVLCDVADRNLQLLLGLGSRADTLFHEQGDEALTRTPFTEPLERLLRDGAADGSLRSSDPPETATVLFNLVGWTYIHLRAQHRWSATRARGATLAIALDGIRAGS